IFSLTPFTRQTLFFSATMAPEIERITNTFLHSPARIEVARAATTSETITQGVVMFKASRKDREDTEKRALLRAMIDAEGEACTNAIIFCNRKSDVDIVAKSLKKYGYNAEPIHGDLDQSQRTRTLDGFRNGSVRFLCASDVAARGLDIPAVSHVFNFDVPSHAEDYVHRIGRTGRAGRLGKAMMICSPRDAKYFEAVEKLIEKEVPRLDNPLGNMPVDDSAAPEGETETKPSRGRDRNRGKGDRPRRERGERGPKPQAEPAMAEAVVAEAAVTVVETREAEAPAPRPERRDRQDRREPRENRGERNNDRNKDRGGHRDRGGDNRIVGMGDDTPEFVRLSFAERSKL
ncbi:MAG: DEAD/DEAH box helicase, partial [Rhodobacteraceae bacterium]|nr:DEAD/DEAH box helicase [Paracoccaceae bacterium]